jgi:hypothetical protein
MKIGAITLTLAFSMGFAFLVLAGMPPASDAGPCPSTLEVAAGNVDDGIGDCVDNCTERDNAGQEDTNSDGYGNMCDQDYDDTLGVSVGNFGTILKVIGATVDPACDALIAPIPCTDVDANQNGGIDVADFGLMLKSIGGPVGPSACAGGSC